MNKRGQAELLVGAILLIGLIVGGVVGSHKIISENRYVGDVNTKIVYDLKFCDIKGFAGNFVSFSNVQDAYNSGYKNAECNR